MRATLALLLAAAVAACTGGIRVTQDYIPQRGVPSQADYAAALGPVPVVMVDNPYAQADVIAALSQNNPRHHRFTAEPPPSLQGGYRVILMFDGRGPAAPCQAPLQAGPATPRSTPAMSVYGAFCVGPALLSEAVATGPRAGSGRDPALARLLGDLLSAIMPYRDPHDVVVED